MNTITMTSRGGLVVELSQSEFDQVSSRLGPVYARESILSDAGRALKHRRELAAHYRQILSIDDLALIGGTALQMMRDAAIHNAAREMGCGPFVERVQAGRHVDPDVWARIVERAVAWAGGPEALDGDPTDVIWCAAAGALGFSTDEDAEYNRRWLRPSWVITAPDGWDGQPASAPAAIA